MSNVWQTPNAPAQPTNTEQYKKINVEDLFKVNPDNLPKPPENWRNKMVSAIGPEAAQVTRNVQAEAPEIIHPKAVNLFMPTFIPQSTQPFPIKSTFFPQQSAAGPNRPQGPQNLSRNDRNPPGHGAFIPLQASRNHAKGSKEQNWRSEERKAIRTKPPPDRPSNTMDDESTVPGPSRTRQSVVPPNPPKSRVAARFQTPTL